MQHIEFVRIAENPELIETHRELKEFLDHLDSCSECSRAANRWLETEATLAPVDDKLREHPSLFRLYMIKFRGLDKNLHAPINLASWHSAYCPICRRRLEKFEFLPTRDSLWITVTVLLLLAAGASLLLYRHSVREATVRTANVKPLNSASESIYLSSGLQVTALPEPLDRAGSSRSTFLPPQKARRILIDSQSEDFGHRLELAIKQDLKRRSYEVVLTRTADARVKIVMMNNEEYQFQYISGSRTWSIQEHISPQNDDTAKTAAGLFMDAMSFKSRQSH